MFLTEIADTPQVTPTAVIVLISILAIIIILKFIKHVTKWILVGIISLILIGSVAHNYNVPPDNTQTPTYYSNIYHAQN